MDGLIPGTGPGFKLKEISKHKFHLQIISIKYAEKLLKLNRRHPLELKCR
jgi:hypothetical protein